MKKKIYNLSSFNWRLLNEEETKKACSILNEMTEEQQWAAHLLAQSFASDAYDDCDEDL